MRTESAQFTAGQNIVLAAEKDITLLAGWDKTHTESSMSSNNAFVGAEASIGTTGAGISVTASVDRQTQHVVSSSATAVDTTLTATQGIAITTPEAVRLNGAEVSAPRIDVSAGSLEITSPQNTYEYKSSATQSGMSISVPVWGAGGRAGSYTTDVSAADNALVNQFDAQKLSNQLQGQQIGSQLVGEVGGQISDRLDRSGVPGFATKDVSNAYGRIGLETAGNALVAAVTGGNPAAVAASTVAGDFASIATRQWAQSVASLLTSDSTAQKALANVLSNIIAAAAGGAVGAASGGKNSSLTALNGAASAPVI